MFKLQKSRHILACIAIFLMAGCTSMSASSAPQAPKSSAPLVGFALANVGLSTPDPERLRRFYEQVLGFRFVRKVPGLPGVEINEIEKDGLVLNLIKVPNQEALPATKAPPRHLETPGMRNLVFWVDDLNSANEYLKNNQVQLLFESRYIDGIGTSVTAFRDPDGNFIAFWQRK